MKCAVLACALLLAASAAADDGFGRLFTTPAQRAALDRQRDATARLAPGNGSVRRSGGPTTRWHDGAAQTQRPPEQERRPP